MPMVHLLHYICISIFLYNIVSCNYCSVFAARDGGIPREVETPFARAFYCGFAAAAGGVGWRTSGRYYQVYWPFCAGFAVYPGRRMRPALRTAITGLVTRPATVPAPRVMR